MQRPTESKRVESYSRACGLTSKAALPGIDALAWYHEKQDEIRGIGLGPEHDWASHGADAFGAMCVSYKEPLPHGHRPAGSTQRAKGQDVQAMNNVIQLRKPKLSYFIEYPSVKRRQGLKYPQIAVKDLTDDEKYARAISKQRHRK